MADNCPECGNTMFKKSGKGYKRPYCINEKCSLFVPEDKRGGRKKTAAAEKTEEKPEEEKTGKKTGTKKTAEKKPTSKKSTGKKPAAKKTTKKSEE